MIFMLICAAVMFALLFIDQITKAWAAAGPVNKTIIPKLLYFRYTENQGIAFGQLANYPVAMTLITIFTVVMIALIAYMFFTVFKANKPAQAALVVVEAGAVGNLIDRLVLGYVRDFVDVSSIGFGICNIADFCITFGAIALVFILLFIGKGALFPLKKQWREQAKAEEEAEKKKKETQQDE